MCILKTLIAFRLRAKNRGVCHGRLLSRYYTLLPVFMQFPIPVPSELIIPHLILITLLALPILTATMICSSTCIVTPQSLLLELKETVVTADDWLFRGYVVTNTRQLKNALASKIDAVIKMFDDGNWEEGYVKLEDEIGPKLTICNTTRVRAKSWLYTYPQDTPEWRAVTSFAAQCQEIIELVLMDQPK